jgi:SNF2 family DNA or RNA helicase
MKRFAHIDPINLTSCKTERSLLDAMTRWKSGNCRLMIGHPASMGHGIDGLQDAGNILVWFGLTWSHSQLCQFNARLRRQGQNKPVICHRIICRDTADYLQLAMLTDKGETQDDLRAALSKYRKERGM